MDLNIFHKMIEIRNQKFVNSVICMCKILFLLYGHDSNSHAVWHIWMNARSIERGAAKVLMISGGIKGATKFRGSISQAPRRAVSQTTISAACAGVFCREAPLIIGRFVKKSLKYLSYAV
jgi:hypothetical protein